MAPGRRRLAGMILATFILLLTITTPPVQAYTIDADAVYFSSKQCDTCKKLEADGTIDSLETLGHTVKRYVIEVDDVLRILRDFQFTYGIPLGQDAVPLLFVGETYFVGRDAINDAYASGELQELAEESSIPDILSAPPADIPLVPFISSAMLDGINPCAIAMLLLFISLLSFTSDKRILVMVSLTFISAIFVSYFLIGTVLFSTLSSISTDSLLIQAVPYIVLSLSGILFLLNMNDFLFASRARYDKVRNQLPSGIQRFNKRMIKRFISTLESGSPTVYAVTFGIGVLISLTEFFCTGQLYLPAILHLVHHTGEVLRGVLLLLVYNLIFVFPLIVIAVIAVMTRTTRSLSALMRENLHWVKLFTALVFLLIFVYYLIDLIGGAS
jgi:cytochrome c biogenesis protein CcdA